MHGSATAGLNRGKLRGAAALMLLVVGAFVLVLVLGLSSSSADSPATATEGPEAKLTAPAGQEIGDGLAGFSVALSGDGTTTLVGAPADNGYAGAAWVLVRGSGKESGWVQQGSKLMAGEAVSGEEGCEEEPAGSLGGEEGAECGFGRALAISSDGSTVLIGAPRQNEQQGAVWVFTRDGEGNWSRTAELTGVGESMKARFGRAVALSADGTTAIVSAPGDEGGHGRVWVFTRSGTTWSQQGSSFVGAGTVGEAHFGGSVAISGDGTRALIGGPGDSGHVGAAWIFKRSGEEWIEEGPKLTGAGADSEARFGGSVALSRDGTTALVGGRGQQEGEGAAWVFTSSGSTWSEEGPPLKADDEAGEEFGYSVALSSDGSSALIGAPHDHEARGSAWLFSRAGDVWSSSPERLEGGSQELGKGWFGASVSLSGDARSALVGAPTDHGKLGAGFVFGPSPSVVAISPNEGPTTGGTTVTISGANLGEATGVNFGATPATSFKAESPSTITAVSPPGTKTVDITVQSPYGTSLAGAQDRFKYRTGSGGGSSTSGFSTSSASGATGAVLGFSASSSSNCGVALLTRKLSVGVHGRAAVRLRGSGAGLCAGKLRLRVRLRAAHGHTTLKTIGTAVYRVLPARTIVVRMKLNAKGHALLKSHGGHLGANLLLVRSSPAPLLSRTASVRLARAKLAKRALPTKK